MTKHTSWAIALTATTFLSAPTIAASLTPTLEENSVFSYSEGSENDYNFTLQEADAEGNLTTKYYKIDLKPEAFATSKNVSWAAVDEDQKDAADVVAVQLPNDQTKYFKYTYTQPEGYETITKPELVFPTITNPTASITYQSGGVAVNNADGNNYGDIKNKLFKDNHVSGKLVNNTSKNRYLHFYGGAIYNAGIIGDIEADFIGNSVTGTATGNNTLVSTDVSAEGGAIYNTKNASINSITGDFINNYASSGGGAIENEGAIGDITGDFIGNYASISGAISNSRGTIGNITGDFIGNYTSSSSSNPGGAIYNSSNATIGNITGDFIGNYASGASYVYGVIYNDSNSTIGNISGNFIGNYVHTSNKYACAYGGAIYNSRSTVNSIIGDFIGNYASGDSSVYGGAIYNSGPSSTINSISGDFIGNYAQSSGSSAYGGAIYNSTGDTTISVNAPINSITGDFIRNYASGSSYASGGAINNEGSGTIGDIVGDFIGNYASGGSSVRGGAIYNSGTIGDIIGDFIGSYASNFGSGSGSYYAYGGAIYNWNKIGNITGDFTGNHAFSSDSSANGGAIDNHGTIGNITSDFIGNYAESTAAEGKANGGAVYTTGKITFTSGANIHFMSGNYTKDPTRGKVYNAVYGKGTPMLTFDTTGGGAWIINDNIEGGSFPIGIDENGNLIYADSKYNLNFTGNDIIDAATGTTTQYVAMNNDIVDAGTVTVNGTTLRFGSYQHEDQSAKNWDGKGAFVASLNDAAAVTNLSLNNGVFDIANGYLETVKLKGYSATDSFMHIDVDPDNMSADMLNVNGNVEGVTKLIVHASSNADIRGKGEILFAESENDTTGNEGSFVVSRVYKSPYLFDVKYDQIADNSNKWYFAMNNEENPDKYVEPEEPDVPDVPTPELPDIPSIKPQPLPGSDRPVAPEVIGAESLPAAALAQNSNMVYNIMNKVSTNRLYCPGCGFYDYYWNGEAFHNLWANAVYNTLRIKTPTDIDAEVWGIEAGGDLQHDLNNKLGLFLSYRKGNYDMSGDGKHHYSTVGSQIDIDSYLAGLYYRYDRNHWWTFATVYGGIQSVDLKTKDGIKSDTDGTEFGGSVELGYDYAINKTLYLTPSVGAFYTQVDYDDATDSAGKIAKYNTLRQLELEVGVKLTKAFVMDEGYANVYVKPSVVQTLNDGDEVQVSGLREVNTLDDQTLGRVELGGRYGFTEQLSTYGWANHTFGDDYKASTFGLGLSYSW